MNKNLKRNIRDAFEAPAPKRKPEFLSSLNFPKTTRVEFVFAQAGYIRKRVWVLTLLAIMPVLLILYSNITENILGLVWVISSLFPFIALAGVTEVARSISHNMAELEISCKFGFSDVVLARLGIISCANTIMFAIVIASFRISGNIEVWRLASYLLVPFLLTCSLSLFTLNRLRGKEKIYICGGISCLVSIANAFLSNQYQYSFANEYIFFWGIALCALLIWTAGETFKLILRLGEYQWNLSSTA